MNHSGTTMLRTSWYNNRLQPCRFHVKTTGTLPGNCADTSQIGNLLDFLYDFDSSPAAGVQNNGNVGSMVDQVQNITYNYEYDELNRIDTAMASGGVSPWSQDFGYDIWGNMGSIAAVNAPGLIVTPQSNNQLAEYSYDASGNMTSNPMGAGALTYDAENRLVRVGVDIFYTYDGDGNRVIKVSGEGTRVYFRNPLDGSVLREHLNGAVERTYAYFNGEHLTSAKSGEGWKYTFRDHLGTLRLRANYTGTVISRHDFYPFGGEHLPTATDESHKFTDQERDAETGLDYFIARHYASNLGRFLQPDEFTGGPVDAFSSNDPLQPGPLPYANITNPLSLNKYTYTYNNPLRYTDPDGHCAGVCAVIVAGVVLPAVAGGVTGFVAGSGGELISQIRSGEGIDVGKAARAGIKPGLAGVAGGATALGPIPLQAFAVGGATLVGGRIERSIDGDPTTDPNDVAAQTQDALVGVAGGIAAGVAGMVAGPIAEGMTAGGVVSQGGGFVKKVIEKTIGGAGKIGAKDAAKDSDADKEDKDP